MITSFPALMNSSAMENPMPIEPPVISTVFPFVFIIITIHYSLFTIHYSLRFIYHPDIFLSVNLYPAGLIKPYMTNKLIFVKRRRLVQVFNVVISLFNIRIDGKISYAERSQVLEKVCALAGIDAVIFQAGFHDQAGGRYLRPPDR